MRTFATLGIQNTFRPTGAGALVGRLVANTAFVEALVRFGRFDRFLFLVGDQREARQLRELFVLQGHLESERFATASLRELPRLLAADEIQVLHHGEPLGRGLDLAFLRDKYAPGPLPITGQIHSLSYPRTYPDWLRLLCQPLSEEDAIFCSTEAGRLVLTQALDGLSASLVARGLPALDRRFALPVVPLGVDARLLGSGDGRAMRQRLGISEEAEVLLGLARFTPYDKMDLVPLLRVFARLRARRLGAGRELVLVLAGSDQGAGTLSELEAWIRLLRIEGSVVFRCDFKETEKKDILAAADVFISPVDNPQETFGLSVIEALAAGLPVICSDFDGYKDTVSAEVGIRVPTTWGGDFSELMDLGTLFHEAPMHYAIGQSVAIDLEALEEAVHSLLEDGLDRMRRSHAARLRAAELYDWSVLIPRYEAVWTELAERHRPRQNVATHHPYGLNYERVFAHYPTRFADDADELSIAPFGQELLLAGVSLPIPPMLFDRFTPELVAVALSWSHTPIRRDKLIGRIRDHRVCRPGDDPRLLIAWLCKHGALQHTGARAAAPANGAVIGA